MVKSALRHFGANPLLSRKSCLLPRINGSVNPATWEKAFCRRDRVAVIILKRST